jgi:outer membrane autotransporter protein
MKNPTRVEIIPLQPIAVQPQEAARLIGVTSADIKSAIKNRRLPGYKITDRKQLILVEDLRAFVKRLPEAFKDSASALAMLAVLGIAGMTAAPAPAAAQSAPDVTYTAPGGLWHEPSNWSSGSVPTAADHVGISVGRSVTVDRDGAVSGDITLDGSSLAVTAPPMSQFFPGNLNSGNVTADGGNVMLWGLGATWVNTGLAVRGGTIVISDGIMQTNGDVSLADTDPSAVLGGTWRVTGTFSLSGVGTEVSLEDGASFQTERLNVAGSSFFVRGAVSSAVANSTDITNAAVSVEQNAAAVLGTTTVANGSLSADDGGAILSTDTLITAAAGQSSQLTASNGGAVETGALTVDGSNGNATVAAIDGQLDTNGMSLTGPNAFASIRGSLATWVDRGIVSIGGGSLALGDHSTSTLNDVAMSEGGVRVDSGAQMSAASVGASGGSFVASGANTQLTIASQAGTNNGEPADGKGDLSLSGTASARIEAGAKVSANVARVDNATGLTVTGSGSEFSTTGTTTIGTSSPSSVTVADGARFNPNTLRVAKGSDMSVSGGGQVAVRVGNSPNEGAHISGTLRVGGAGSSYTARSTSPTTFDGDTAVTEKGRVEVTNGGTGNGRLAVRDGSATVDGTGSAWNGTVTIGGAGAGTSGAVVARNGAKLADVRVQANGSAEITSGAQASSLTVNGGNAVVSDGGKVVPTSPFSGGTVHDGSVRVTGAGSTWMASSLNVDSMKPGGSAELNVENGGKVDVGNGAASFGYAVAAGGPTGATGTIRVTGEGSSLIANGTILLGTFGSGMLSIADVATVESFGGRLGLFAGGIGVADITRGTWDARGDALTIGFGGTGLLNVGMGGKLLADQIQIGGGVLEDEPDTGAGTGQLTVANRGSVEAQRIAVGTSTGAGTLAIGGAPGSAPRMAGTVKAGEIALGDKGDLTFNHTDPEYMLNSSITGTGRVDVLAGNTTLAGESTYTGPTTVFGNATLNLVGSITSPTTVRKNGLLTGHGTIDGDLANAGVIAPSWCSCNPFGSLTVTGKYVSNGGALELQTALGNSSSNTDMLRVGSTEMGTGATQVFVSNAGGLGAADASIRVVDVTGGAGASAAGIFTLGQRVAAGAYDYSLARKSDGGWYLQTGSDPVDPKPQPRPEVPLFAAVPDLARLYDLQSLGTYDARRGGLPELSQTDPTKTVGWGRIFGSIGDQKGDLASGSGPSFGYGIAGFQAGVDLYQAEHAGGSIGTAGAYVSVGSGSADVKNGSSRVAAGKFDLVGYTVGGYYTHRWASGAYVDAVAQATKFDGTASSVLGQSSGTQGYGLTGSIEAGMPFAIGGGWMLEPQAQAVVQHIALDDITDAYGQAQIGDQSVVTGRVGAKLSRSFLLDNGTRVGVWAKASVLHSAGDFGKITMTTLSGDFPISYKLAKGGTSASLEAGVAAQISDSMSLFATASYDAGIGGGRKGDHGFGGRVGLQVKF